MTNRLNTTTSELNELKNKNSGATLDQMLEDSAAEELDESRKTIEKLKEENKYYEKQIEELKQNDSKAKKAEELEAKNTYLNDTIETMKKNIEELKNQKKKSEEDFKQEIKRIESDLGQIKLQLATTAYEKEMQATKYRRYIEKLKNKLISFGVKFREKRNSVI